MKEEEAAVAIQSRLIEYARELQLARATDLARSERYLEAEALLCPLGQLPAGPKELDLLARIALRRWRPADARRFWEAAIRADPAAEEYKRCLEGLRDWHEKRKLWTVIAAIAFSICIAALLRAGIVHFRAAHSDRRPRDQSQQIGP